MRGPSRSAAHNCHFHIILIDEILQRPLYVFRNIFDSCPTPYDGTARIMHQPLLTPYEERMRAIDSQIVHRPGQPCQDDGQAGRSQIAAHDQAGIDGAFTTVSGPPSGLAAGGSPVAIGRGRVYDGRVD